MWGRSGHGNKVKANLTAQMWEHWENMVDDYGRDAHNWEPAAIAVERFISGVDETFIDDYIG
jgi:hypothetical protein